MEGMSPNFASVYNKDIPLILLYKIERIIYLVTVVITRLIG